MKDCGPKQSVIPEATAKSKQSITLHFIASLQEQNPKSLVLLQVTRTSETSTAVRTSGAKHEPVTTRTVLRNPCDAATLKRCDTVVQNVCL